MNDTTEMIRLAPPGALDMALGEAMFTPARPSAVSTPLGRSPTSSSGPFWTPAPRLRAGRTSSPRAFLVIRDRERVREFGALYHEAWWAKRRDEYGWSGKADIPEGSPYRMPALLADEMADAPVVLLAFSLPSGVAAASTFPAVQNILLAARALGIGSVLTTLHPQVMERVYAMFGVPAEMVFHCCIPLGYPRGRFGPTVRYPTSQTTSWNDWANPPPWA